MSIILAFLLVLTNVSTAQEDYCAAYLFSPNNATTSTIQGGQVTIINKTIHFTNGTPFNSSAGWFVVWYLNCFGTLAIIASIPASDFQHNDTWTFDLPCDFGACNLGQLYLGYTTTGPSTLAACYNFHTVTITGTVNISSIGNSSICLGDCITLTASSGLSNYSWNPGGSISPSITVCPTNTTTYSVTAVNSNGCISSDNITIGIHTPPPALTISPDQFICPGESATLTVSLINGDETAVWEPGILQGTSITVNPTTTTTYTVTFYGGATQYCTDPSATVIVNVIPKPIADLGPDQTICSGQSVTLNGCLLGQQGQQGQYSYSWTGFIGLIPSSGTPCNITVSPTSNATYCLTITDNITGCESIPSCVNVYVDDPITPLIALPLNICAGEEICFTGGFTGGGGNNDPIYSWSFGDGNSSTSTTTATACNIYSSPGTYNVSFTIINACGLHSTSGSVVVYAPPVLSLNAYPTCQTQCTGSIDMNVTGNGSFTFSWTGPLGYTSTFEDLSGLCSGTYNVTVTDVYGCESTGSIDILQGSPPIADLGPDQTICSGQSVTINGCLLGQQGQQGQYSYSWTGPTGLLPTQGTPCGITVSPISDATYCITITDNFNGCVSNQSCVTVYIDNPVTASFLPLNGCPNQEICFPVTQPINGFGDNPTFIWDFGDGNTSTSNTTAEGCNTYLVPFTYVVTFTVINTCSSSSTTQNVIVNTPPTVDAGPDQTVCQGDVITLNATGNSGLNYVWLIDDTDYIFNLIGQSVTFSASTSFFEATVIATDPVTGCSSEDVLNIFADLGINHLASQVGICPGGSILLNVLGNNTYTYSWSPTTGLNNPNIQTPVASPSTTTTYTVTGTSSNGCVFTDQVTVFINSLPSVSLTETNNNCCGPKVITATPSGGAQPYTYLWNTGATSSSISVIPAFTTTYSVTVTDANGCDGIDFITVDKLLFGPFNVSIPNVFTPNGDNINDLWLPNDPTNPSGNFYNACSFTLTVYGRWNQPVHILAGAASFPGGFSGNVINWDGSYFGGAPVSDGTYFYILTLTNCTGTQTFVGHVMILGGKGKKKCQPPAGTPLSRLHNNQVVSKNSLWNNQIHYVEGTLTIPAGAKLNINNSEIKFEEGASIVVERGGKLHINNSTLSGCGQALWGAIEVRGDASKKQTPSNQGILRLHNSVIRDASIGILAGKFDNTNPTPILDPNYGGGKIHLNNNSEMSNNGIHIVMSEYGGFKNRSIIEETAFGSLNPGNLLTASSTHILIIENNGVTITNNYIESAIIGIDLRGSSDFNISDNTFEGIEIAISTKDSKAGTESEITRNKFNNSEKAIKFKNDNHSKLNIRCNEFNDFSQYAIKSENTILKDQGSQQEGPGNEFISNSQLQYNRLDHTGPNLKYHYDPQSVQSFVNPLIMSSTVIKVPANADRNCNSYSAKLAPGESENGKVKGIENHLNFNNDRIDIHPNPNSGIFNLMIELDNETTVAVEIMDVLGNLVYRKGDVNTNGNLEVDISTHPKGIYFVKIVSGDEIVVKKVVYQ
ncbi:gliding motility-associated C-terminal domain-containing protein [Bacteroidales bacterium AH-315-I05]|nr:gliding motility-associated C-terminal domain-containing protein [Bacteroidales bacterium AH-315-I05]